MLVALRWLFWMTAFVTVLVAITTGTGRMLMPWLDDLEGLCREFGCSDDEVDALRDVDVRRLMDIGVHQYLIPHILRLFYGVTGMTNNHPAMEAYRRAFPEESRQALEGTIWQRESD